MVESGLNMSNGQAASSSCGCAMCQPAAGADGLKQWSWGDSSKATSTSVADTAYYISALLPSSTPRWGSGGVGTSASVKYSFMSSAPTYADSSDKYGFAACNDSQKTAFRSAIALWAAVANITFTEVTDSISSDIRIGTNDQGGISSGYAYYPAATYGGDIYIANDLTSMQNPSSPGSFGFSTVVHELGHAIGLKHPGNYNAGGGGTEGPYLPSGEDSEQYSVMSYNSHPTTSATSQMPQLYDIAAVQYLYGANTSYNSGDNTYTFSDTSTAFIKTIWDGGGTDTFDCSAQTLASTISLVSGAFSSIGSNGSSTTSASNNVAIAFGATIENATGGAGNDVITGNTANNVLTGGAGNDTLTGGTGNDTLIGGNGTDVAAFSAASSNYLITTASDGTVTVQYLSSGSDGTDTLTGIEVLRFSDKDVKVGTDTSSTTPSFSAYAYAAYNTDLFNAFGTDTTKLMSHYVTSGKTEGRTAKGFDPYAYAAGNADLFNAFGTDVSKLIQHFVSSGRSEGRSASGFNVYAYAAQNADLYNAFGVDVSKLISHYVNSGKAEGRSASGFDPYAYAAGNSDLFAAFGTDISKLVGHYVNSGKAEGRSATGFSVEGYAAQNADLYNAFGVNSSKLVQHFIDSGKAEGRDPGIAST